MSLHFGFILPNLGGGGAEKAILKVVLGLMQRQHNVSIVLLEYFIQHNIFHGIPIHTLTPENSHLHSGILGKWVAAWRLRSLIYSLSKKHPFDLIVSSLPFADQIAIHAKLPRHWCRIADTLSIEISKLRQLNKPKAKQRLARYRRIYKNCPLIAVSDGVAEDIRSGIGIQPPIIERIYNPFDYGKIQEESAKSIDLPAKPYIIHVGRFSPQKRYDVLLDAWQKINTNHVLVLLTPNPDINLKAMVENRGLEQRVIVVAFQPNPYPWIANADLLVVSSDHEGLPNVIIEALILGTPVVSTDCPSGPREILGDSLSHCLVPVGNHAALAQAIQSALEQPPDISKVDLTRFDYQIALDAYERLATTP